MRNKVLLIVAVLVVVFANPALAQSTIPKAPGGNTTPPPAANTAPPTVTITTPANGATYKKDDSVKASYSCKNADGSTLSQDRCTAPVGNGATIDMSPGPHDFTVKATGNNGKQAQQTTYYTVQDVKPTITINTPENKATYKKDQPVKADYECKGIAGNTLPKTRCVGPVDNGAVIDMSPGPHNFIVKATDNDGTQTQTTNYYTVEDVKPTITITIPEDKATYKKGQSLKADYECKGINGNVLPKTRCVGPVDNGDPIDMSAGPHSFIVKATDDDGTQTQTTNYYTVSDSSGGGGNGGGGGNDNGDGSNGPGGDSGNGPGGGGGSTNIVIGSIRNVTYNVVGSISNVTYIVRSIRSARVGRGCYRVYIVLERSSHRVTTAKRVCRGRRL